MMSPGSGRNQPEAFPDRRRCFQHARPAAILLVLARRDWTARKGVLRRAGGERVRREFIDAVTMRADRDGCVLFGVQGHVLELRFAALARMDPVEIERKRVEELEVLVVLEQPLLLDPARRLWILAELGLQPLLTIELAIEHSLRNRPVLLRNLVDQHHAR